MVVVMVADPMLLSQRCKDAYLWQTQTDHLLQTDKVPMSPTTMNFSLWQLLCSISLVGKINPLQLVGKELCDWSFFTKQKKRSLQWL